MQDISQRKAYKAQWYAANRERISAERKLLENRARHNEQQKRRYATNPLKRATDIARSRAWYRQNREYASLTNRLRGQLHADERRTSRRKYYVKNKGRINQKNKEWAERNLIRKKRVDAEWRKNNVERKREANRTWSRLNPEKAKASQARWKSRNPERATRSGRERAGRYRATKFNATVNGLAKISEWEASWKRKRSRVRCYWCKQMFPPKDCHSDHIVALSKGGAHSIENLCISCESCNLRKSAKTFARWQQELVEPALL